VNGVSVSAKTQHIEATINTNNTYGVIIASFVVKVIFLKKVLIKAGNRFNI
jgi:hypothetical protein